MKTLDQKDVEEYNLEKIYEEKFSPLVSQLYELSQQYDLPFAAVFQIAAKKNGAAFASTARTSGNRPISPQLILARQIFGPESAIEAELQAGLIEVFIETLDDVHRSAKKEVVH